MQKIRGWVLWCASWGHCNAKGDSLGNSCGSWKAENPEKLMELTSNPPETRSLNFSQKKVMLKVFLTIDPKTLRALYDDEAKLLGTFQSMSEAEEALGDMLNYCTIHSEGQQRELA